MYLMYFSVRFSSYPSCILVCQNVAILYTISKQIAISTNIEHAERVRFLAKSKYNFNYFTGLQSACTYQGKLQINYAFLTFCELKHRIIFFTITD